MKRTFKLEKETKGAYRFQEETQGEPPVIGTLYMRKWAFDKRPTELEAEVRGEGLVEDR